VTGEVVLDASVVLKWVFPPAADEADVERALDLLAALREGSVTVVQPVHWLAEVAGVVARRHPRRARQVIGLLHSMELPVLDHLGVYERAATLASDTGQHLFDTLYHAVALARPAASLVTADERYYRAARRAGRVVRLAEAS
jgi:predicted nucleic acid-binding protein